MVTRLTSRVQPSGQVDAAALLARTSLFADLTVEEMRELAAVARRRSVRRGSVLLAQDAMGETAFILLSGRVDIVAESSDGREFLLARLTPGEMFGEMALLDGEPRSASAIAHEDSEVLVIARADLLAQLERHPRIMLGLLQSLSRRLRRADERLNAFAFRDVSSRLAEILLRLSEREGHGAIQMDQQQIADQVGAARQTVSRILNEWRRQDWVEIRRGEVRIRNGAELRRLLE